MYWLTVVYKMDSLVWCDVCGKAAMSVGLFKSRQYDQIMEILFEVELLFVDCLPDFI